MKTRSIMPAQEALKGLIVPVLTPFSETGAIDEAAFIRHLAFLKERGVERVMVNGTTGEFYSLLPRERRRMFALARRHFDGWIVLHAGGCGLIQNRIEVRWANRMGADAVAVLPPIYPAGLAEEGMIRYFQILAEEAEVPFILYNFPRHTGNALTPEILKAVPHAALKDSAKALHLVDFTPNYFVGSSSDILESVRRGAAGFVAATANVRPELYSAFESLLIAARSEEAAVMQQEVQAYSAPFSTGGVPMLKQALARVLKGYPLNVRPPLMADG